MSPNQEHRLQERMNINYLQRTTAGFQLPTHRQPNRRHQRFGQRVLAAWIPLLRPTKTVTCASDGR